MKKSTVKSIAFAAVAIFAALPLSAATVKALSFAINIANTSNDDTPIMTYMATNDVDFGIFEHTKLASYFIDADFSQDGKNFRVAYYQHGNNDIRYFVYSDKYTLVNTPLEDKSGNNMVGIFQDAYGDQYALISLRNTYKDDKPTTLTPAKNFIEGIVNKYPDAKIIVTYNAWLTGTYNGKTQQDILNTYLTENSSGPQMTCLGRTDADGTAIGGVYMYPDDVPSFYSVSLVPKSIGTMYDGTLATFEVPTKYKVIFNDWDGTGLQTNIVFVGQSVTPPTVPGRDGYTFTGWDHADSEFESVSESFTATAQYASNAAWLHVSGDPENLGTADPAYGAITEISANDTFTATVSNPAVEEDATERWVCTGYSHYEITDLATGAKTVAQEGNGSSFSYTHFMHDELVWHFTNEWLVSVSATAGGSVSVAAENWVRNGETISLVATPEEGSAFWRWDGDTDGIDATSASISPTIQAARSLRAVFALPGADASVQYVSKEGGSDDNSGYFQGAPKATIQAAIDTLAAKPGYGTVRVGGGTYDLQDTVMITNAIAVLGATGNPKDVILRAKDVATTTDMIALRVNHADAFVANLVVENGHGYQQQSTPVHGSNVAIEGNGGTVSNCVIRGGTYNGMYARGVGAWLNSDAALLTHCVVTNNNTSGSSKQISGGNIYGGLFVHIEKGVVANCLIANNRDAGGTNVVTDERQSWACGVTVRNGCILNCTVVTNEARYTGGIYLYPEGYATNVVVAGCVNRCTFYVNDAPKFTDIGFKGTITNASHCASDGGEALDDETCVAGTAAKFFRSMADCDYRPALDSPLINAGIAYEGIASFDLLGKKRVQGRAPDIGCFESAPSGLSVVIR